MPDHDSSIQRPLVGCTQRHRVSEQLRDRARASLSVEWVLPFGVDSLCSEHLD
jgi:hypothetical protein